jgi:SRSO17 transposase
VGKAPFASYVIYAARPDWKRLSAEAGTKGPRLHDWCYLELADLEVEEFYSAHHGLWTRGLLIRRNIADGDLAFFTTWCPAGTSIETLVTVEGHRWAIEDSFETAKNEFGLDHNESRSWHGWHRHVSLVMLAFAMMAVIRHRANSPPPKKSETPNHSKKIATLQLIVGQSRKSAASLSGSPESGSNPHISSHGHSGVELTRPPLSARTLKQIGNCSARAIPFPFWHF